MGNSPDRSFLLTSRYSSFVRPSNFSGRCPESLLAPRSNVSSSVSSAMPGGTSPSSLFPRSRRCLSRPRRVIPSGIDPVILLLLRSSVRRL